MPPPRRFWVKPLAPPGLFVDFCRAVGVTRQQCQDWWSALARARWSQAVEFRQRLREEEATLATRDGRRALTQTLLAPHALVEVLEALVQEQVMTRKHANVLHEQILRRVTAAGHWRETTQSRETSDVR